MRRVVFCLLVASIVFAGYGVRTAVAQEQPAKPATAEKQLRWHGIIIRFNKDQSNMDVRKGTVEKKIYFDSSTQWTKGKEVLPDMSQFKEGSDVICIGKAGAKGEFQATRVQLQP
ncbi:MAG TPA: hypothetical protein VMG63_02030 [Terriglobia bacterium]|jgi:hypothetical protein|nr:hypothetical protein [Terriglobia bacterium]